MPYPVPIDQRHAQAMADIRRRLAVLDSRTACLDSGWPVAALPAVIDPGYTSGDPKIYLNGATTLSGPYQHLASYTPVAGDNVLVIPVGVQQSYVVLGRLA